VIVVWTVTALDHIAAIMQYVSQTSHIYAEQVAQRILHRGKQLESFPESGRVVPEVGKPDTREIIEQPYRVIYRVTETRVEIVAVVHARRADVAGKL